MSDGTDFSVTSDIFLCKSNASAGKTMFCPHPFFGDGRPDFAKIVKTENSIRPFFSGKRRERGKLIDLLPALPALRFARIF